MDISALEFGTVSATILSLVIYCVGDAFSEDASINIPTWKKILVSVVDAIIIVIILYALAYVSSMLWIKFGVCSMTSPCYIFNSVNVC